MVARNHTEKLDLRLSKSAKEALRVAARKSVSEFVLEAALGAAEEPASGE